MKIDIQWGAKNSGAKYRVTGEDLESVSQALAGREAWGEFDWTLNYKWLYDATGDVKRVRVIPAYTITMPAWPGYRKQPGECKEAWDTMWRALMKHEKGHLKIFERGIARIVRELEGLRAAKVAEVERLTTQANEEIEKEESQFDRETDHGRSRGVEIVIPGTCRRKVKDKH